MQELGDSTQQITDPEAITVILRRWNPAQMTLGPLQELTINSKSKSFCKLISRRFINVSSSIANDEVKSLVATLSAIPVENIEYAKVGLNCLLSLTNSQKLKEHIQVGRSFPRSSVSLLDVHTSLPWTSNKSPNHVFRLSNKNDGNVYYYRSVRLIQDIRFAQNSYLNSNFHRDKTEELKNESSKELQDVGDQST